MNQNSSTVFAGRSVRLGLIWALLKNSRKGNKQHAGQFVSIHTGHRRVTQDSHCVTYHT